MYFSICVGKNSILRYIIHICYTYYNQRHVTFYFLFKPNIAKRQKHLTRKRTVGFILSRVSIPTIATVLCDIITFMARQQIMCALCLDMTYA